MPRQKSIGIDDLRRFAVARTFLPPTTLKRALNRLGFVQADPIRAPARAQDLILRHRVKDYRAGDLERFYAKLGVEEDFFVVYGFVSKAVHALMHPRASAGAAMGVNRAWSPATAQQAQVLLRFIRERGTVHPRDVEKRFSQGTVKNYWGGQSNATTHLLSAMHYSGMLRVAHRESGVRLYSAYDHGPGPEDPAEINERLDALVDVAVGIYAPAALPGLSYLVRRLCYAVPQWRGELRKTLHRAKERLAHARVEGVDWYWPVGENPPRAASQETVRLLTPFDPLVWDRGRFESFWNWAYRFEAYTPVAKRILGYYALPPLWRDRVIGWANLSMENGELRSAFGYAGSGPPRDAAFKRELEAELDRMRSFLSL